MLTAATQSGIDFILRAEGDSFSLATNGRFTTLGIGAVNRFGESGQQPIADKAPKDKPEQHRAEIFVCRLT